MACLGAQAQDLAASSPRALTSNVLLSASAVE